MAQFIAYSIGVFLAVIILLVIILLVAKKYLSPSGNQQPDGYPQPERHFPAFSLWR